MGILYRRLPFCSRDHERVSRYWYQLLLDLHRDGVPFNVNEGHRTMARQRELVAEKGLWSPSNPTGAAAPSRSAPHIRTGRQDHAIDFDNAEDVINAAARRGVKLTRPIATEPWHVEADRASLRAYYLRRVRERAHTVVRPGPVNHVGRRGVRLVARFEGFRAKPYQDTVGVWTIGYGHTKDVGPDTKPWTRRHARAVLRHELDAEYACHVRALGLPLTQPMFDALTSFVYNLGPGAIGDDTGIGRALRAHRWRAAADQMLRWDQAAGRTLPGLTRRRRAERRLFLKKLPKTRRPR